MAERFSVTGFKLPAAFARLSYFNLALDWLYDPMHEIMNLAGNRLATTLLGLDFNEAARNFAEEEGLHPEWGPSDRKMTSNIGWVLEDFRGFAYCTPSTGRPRICFVHERRSTARTPHFVLHLAQGALPVSKSSAL
ncbi:hypothetical protein CYMTET_56705 [Cymbomonas tetramitiformis]|uniref:Uncharacterized protein n=1 Tax=Cymbomonas tetramitiformis TaxID=36881 RepID=A0AAE0EMA8_9CHLO|nr:hypothetical protein CYMTET_56705 [Cymbomonas tetramitiformis]